MPPLSWALNMTAAGQEDLSKFLYQMVTASASVIGLGAHCGFASLPVGQAAGLMTRASKARPAGTIRDCGRKARGAKASTRGEANDNRLGMLRAVTRIGHLGWIMPQQSFAGIHDEARKVHRHYRGGRRTVQRKLHQRVLDSHGSDAQLACNDYASRLWIRVRTSGETKNKRADQHQQLQQ